LSEIKELLERKVAGKVKVKELIWIANGGIDTVGAVLSLLSPEIALKAVGWIFVITAFVSYFWAGITIVLRYTQGVDLKAVKYQKLLDEYNNFREVELPNILTNVADFAEKLAREWLEDS
jgi:hypothetical protein